MPTRPAALRPPPRIGGRNCVTSSGLAGFAEQAAKPATEIGQAGGLTATFGDPRAGTSHRNTTAQIVLTCADGRSACIRLVTAQTSLGLRPHCAWPKAHCRPHHANGCPTSGIPSAEYLSLFGAGTTGQRTRRLSGFCASRNGTPEVWHADCYACLRRDEGRAAPGPASHDAPVVHRSPAPAELVCRVIRIPAVDIEPTGILIEPTGILERGGKSEGAWPPARSGRSLRQRRRRHPARDPGCGRTSPRSRRRQG
jgi:hypothetical protein